MSPNLRIDSRLNSRWSINVGISGNPFKFEIAGCKFNNFRFQPEFRYWLNRPFTRHYIGIAAMGGWYSFHIKDRNFIGDVLAIGPTYGYCLVLNSHWNLEFTGGVGIGHTRGFDYHDYDPEPEKPNFIKWVPLPINLGVSFTYIFY